MEKLTTDILIIGGGLAAMMAALEASASPLSILMASKGKVGNSGATLMAGSNFAAVLPEAQEQGDTIAIHIEDTFLGGGRHQRSSFNSHPGPECPRGPALVRKVGSEVPQE